MLGLISGFFEFDASRLANPLVIVGIIFIVIGIVLMIARAKLAFEITKRLKGGNDEVMSKVAYGIIGLALVLVIAGSLMAILALPPSI